MDQDFTAEPFAFFLIRSQQLGVRARIVDSAHGHSLRDPAIHRVLLVAGIIDVRRRVQHAHDPIEFVDVFLGIYRAADVGVAYQPREFGRHVAGRKHEIDTPGGDGGRRHSRVLGTSRVLGERHPAGPADVPHPDRPIGAHPGKDHGDRVHALVVRKIRQEPVDWQVTFVLVAFDQAQDTVFDRQIAAGRNDVNRVGPGANVALQFAHGE